MSQAISHKITSNFTWQILDRIVRGGGVVLINIFIGRRLGAEKFGLINYCLALFSFFQVISTFGLDFAVVKRLSLFEEDSHRSSIVKTSLIIKFFVSCLATILACFYAYFFEADLKQSGIVFLSVGLLFSFLDVFKFYYESKYLLKVFALSEILTFVVFSILKLVNVLYFQNFPLLFLTYGLEFVFGKLILAFLYHQQHSGGVFSGSSDKDVFRALLNQGFPQMLASFSVILYMRIDQIMIGRMLGNQSLGIYSSAVRLSEAWYFIPVAVNAAFFPYFVRLKNQKEGNFSEKFQLYYDFMALISILVLLAVVISPEFWVTLFFGPEYKDASSILLTHIFAGIFVSLSVASNAWLNIEDRQNIIFFRTFLGAIINLGLNFLFIGSLGSFGCALATVISYGLSVFSILLFKDLKICGVQMCRSFNLLSSVPRLLNFVRYRKAL